MKPYVLDDQMCDECQGQRCGGKFAPFFCANVTCLQVSKPWVKIISIRFRYYCCYFDFGWWNCGKRFNVFFFFNLRARTHTHTHRVRKILDLTCRKPMTIVRYPIAADVTNLLKRVYRRGRAKSVLDHKSAEISTFLLLTNSNFYDTNWSLGDVFGMFSNLFPFATKYCFPSAPDRTILK